MLMVDVPGFNVRPDETEISQGVALPAPIAQMAVPILSVLVFVLLETKLCAVTAKVTASNVPCVRVRVEFVANAPARVTTIPAPLIVVLPKVPPLGVIVAEARNVGCTEAYVGHDPSVRFP